MFDLENLSLIHFDFIIHSEADELTVLRNSNII